MSSHIHTAVLLGLALVPAGSGLAAEPIPTALSVMLKNGANIQPLPDQHGLKSVLATVEDNGTIRGQVFYLSPDGEAFIAGEMFDKDGRSISKAQVRRVNDEALLSGVEKSALVSFGSKGPTLYMFADPRCSATSKAFAALEPIAAQGGLRLRLVPVGVVTRDSGTLAAGVLGSKDRAQAWKAVLRGEATSGKLDLASIEANEKVFRAHDLPGTPFFAYRNATGAPEFLYGVPDNLAAFLAQVGVSNKEVSLTRQ